MINPFPTIHDNCRLLAHLPMYFGGSLYFKQYEPRSDCSLRSCLIRIHSVCFHGSIYWLGVDFNTSIYAADVISRHHFHVKKILAE